jgi:hypothetical protein
MALLVYEKHAFTSISYESILSEATKTAQLQVITYSYRSTGFITASQKSHCKQLLPPTCKIKSSIVQTSWQRTITDLHKSVRGFMNIINLIPAISTWPHLWESEHDLPLQCMFVSQACLSVYMILLSNFTRNLITTAIKAPAPGTFHKSENRQCLDNLCLWHLDLHPQPDLCITVYELNKQLDVVSDGGGRSSGWFIVQTQIISSWNLLPAAGLAIPQLLQYSGV